MDNPRQLYPYSDPWETGRLDVSGGHRLFWASHGNPNGLPVLHLCGGPGGSPARKDSCFFSPFGYRTILLHPRGCGRSTPEAGIDFNTLPDLISDIEVLRHQLGIASWVLSGASWGTTVALAYAQQHPERVRALMLRGIFLCNANELDWLYGGGAAARHAEAWDHFAGWTGASDRKSLLEAYARALHCGDPDEEFLAASRWCAWEDHLAGVPLMPYTPALRAPFQAQARLSVHYFQNMGFLTKGQLLRNASILKGIPGRMIQGTCDEVTPMGTAQALNQAWSGSTLTLVESAGHLPDTENMVDALIRTSNELLLSLS